LLVVCSVGDRTQLIFPSRSAAPGNTETQAAVANFLKSLEGGQGVQGQEQSAEGKLFTSLADVLLPQTTIPVVDKADDTYLDELLSHLPPALVMMSASADEASADPDPETVQAVIMSLETEQKLRILRKVLRSPQFHQSLGSLTMALRDGGLPTISEALKIPVANGGYMRRGGVPVGGGDAVEAFLKGIKTQIEDEQENREYMDTD
jgi:26S proteasome regulatory subunit N13